MKTLTVEEEEMYKCSTGPFQEPEKNLSCSRMKQFCHCNIVNYSETVMKVLNSGQGILKLRQMSTIIKNMTVNKKEQFLYGINIKAVTSEIVKIAHNN